MRNVDIFLMWLDIKVARFYLAMAIMLHAAADVFTSACENILEKYGD